MRLTNYSSIRKYIRTLAVMLLTAAITAPCAMAASPEKYAKSSVLSEGTWVRIDIRTPGIQTLSRQTLRNFGFNDPEKVHVYGYGGRMVPEILSPDMPYDLPAVATFRKGDGSISFYATGNITVTASTNSAMTFDHYSNPYCDASYYFLSDREPSAATAESDMTDISDMEVETHAVCQLVHEAELMHCAESGREYLGEDFRSQKSQEFRFDLPDNAEDQVKIRIRFGAKTTGAPSSILVSANGNRLAATSSDRISAVTESEQYYNVTTTAKTAKGIGETLNVGIEYSQAGVVSTARLDWIQVEYRRLLRMRDSQLHFTVRPSRPTAYSISGASENTMVWDVTEPHNIKIVKGTYDSSAKTFTFGVKTTGIREFMAFDPDVKGATVQGRVKIANQDIHAMPAPDMLIISPSQYASAAERIANLHREHDGMTVYVLAPDKIYNEFSGGHPDVSAFRKLLKMWYDRDSDPDKGTGIKYCLLMGRPTFDQKRKNPETLKSGYPNTLIWQSKTSLSETTSYCTDDFIGMLDDEISDRNMAQRAINVGIGRYPVTSLYDANIAVDKLEAYMTTPDYGIWRNNVMVIADDGDNANHLNQAQQSIENMQKYGAGPHYSYDRVYLDAFQLKQTGTGLEFPDAKERMLKKWEKEGAAIINYIGHANPKEWSHERLLTWNDITSMTNQHLPILYAATCSFGKWDAPSESGAEVMMTNPAGGAIAVITPSRTVYISRNRDITNSICAEMTRRAADGNGQRIGDILRLGKNNCSSKNDNMNRYHLFGDPALRMPVAQMNVAIDSIAGSPVAQTLTDSPALKARSTVKVSGRITDTEGNTVDFNGPVQYVLYDAEQSITTNGWGESGIKSLYQDRSSKLATGSAMADSGKWTVTIQMPSEIANNYTPAFLAMYAYDTEARIEANGSTQHLYVYGYDTTASDDTEGPEIENFYINTPTFAYGDMVNPNPVAMATFSDASGINISDAGIGHKMSLTLDNDNEYDDLGNYFVPDPDCPGKGSIVYPLSGIEPGEHELKLTVWDNANNSSSADIRFKVGINMKPAMTEFNTVYDRTNDQLSLSMSTDRSMSKLGCTFECFNLNGERLWMTERNIYSGNESTLNYVWDLKDTNGNRLARGIYIMRATITTDEGLATTKSKNFAIPAK